MAPKIQIPADYDFKVRVCVNYAHHPWNLHRNPKTAEIKQVAEFFAGRCARLRGLMQLPAQIGNATIKLRDTFTRSIFEVTGRLEAGELTAEQQKKIESRSNDLFAEMADQTIRLQGTPEWDDHVLKSLVDGLVAVEHMGADPRSFGMLQASMMSYLTTGWTIIETMSGDLWEAALNAHPSSLANLTGSPKRLKGGQVNKSSAQSAKEWKSVSLDDISMHGFNIENKMGSILRSKFNFASLEGIREAYACAFGNRSPQVERALIDPSLDSLSAIRNVIVHRDAHADNEYIKKTKGLGALPKAELREHILLNGDIVVRLLKPAIVAANQLLIAVDDWLAKARQA